ncbi:MAG: pyrroline-5-carboxylate reductase [Rhodospirillaceae bacterium]|nr:MAG: pyrroline-5-carboxylate reductase [Rhodospirillaceae bacterium]
MSFKNRSFDDLARVAGGALGALGAFKQEIRDLVRQQIDRLLADQNLVPREEFEAVKAMAARARSEQAALEKRVLALEGASDKAKPKAKAKPQKKKV